jgi:D-3-phosphoglycerate dehydrogenase
LKANALRFDTLFYDPYVVRGQEKMLNSRRVECLDELLSESDIVSINCPLSDETKGLVDSDFLAKMKQGSSFVNTARGAIVSDVDVFYEPLQSGHLSNVSLDVIPFEPPGNAKIIDAWRNREAWLDGRFILNPHTAYYSDRAYVEMRQKAALNAKRILDDLVPYNIVNGM